MSRYWYEEMKQASEDASRRTKQRMAADGCDIRTAGERLHDALYPIGTPGPMRERRVIEPHE